MTYVFVAKLLIWIALPGSMLFPIMYALYTRKRLKMEAWYQTDVGRHLMAFSVTVALALLNSVIIILFRTYPGRMAASLALEALVAIVTWWRVILYVRVRFLHGKRGKHHVDAQVLERRTGEMPENGCTDVSGSTGD